MDVRLPDGSGLEAASDVVALRPGTAVIIMTAHADNLMALEAADAGAAGFLLKEVRIAKIVTGVRRAATGALAVEPAVLEAMLAEAKADGSATMALSTSEREVVRLLAEGLDRDGIAAELGLDESEVAGIAAEVRRHLNARSNLEAVVKAARAGFFGPDQDSRARISNR
jgi:DNA-binding NarL/FixJ family response regulator